jgi:DNA-binding MarR family transcriptional regulator
MSSAPDLGLPSGLGLPAEIGKKKPFDVPEEEAFLNIARSYSILMNEMERFFKPSKLSFATYNVLRILRSAQPDGKTCSQIGADMVARVPDVTRLIDRLETANLVTRNRQNEDRRIVRVRITPAGLTLVNSLDTSIVEFYRSKLGHLSKPQIDALNALLYLTRHPEALQK